MEVFEAMLTRRSVREYTAQPVPDELVHELLAAAMQAPSAGNQQPWHFIVLTERQQLNAVADALPFGKMLHHAPIAIVVCGDEQVERFPGFWVQDCAAATQNLLLAAHGKGLGAVWVGVYPVEDRVADLQQVLGLPEPVRPFAVVPLGYPATPLELPAQRYDVARVHANRWHRFQGG